MMEQYDPGNRAADIAPVFADLKTFLKDFVPEALAAQEAKLAARPLKPLNAPFPIEKQKALGLAMMEAIGFDFDHGRLDISHHPFCGGVPTDVRMTTRYTTDEFLSSLMGILHETGHGLYEQGLPKEWSHWPVGKARGMAIHESQSLFVEKQIARSPNSGNGPCRMVASISAPTPSPAGTSRTCSPMSTSSSAASSASMPTRRPIRSTSSCASRSSRS